MHVLYPRARFLIVAGCLTLGLAVAGCDTKSRYPKNLRYPARTDPLVADEPKAVDIRTPLPSPGSGDEGLKRGVEAQLFKTIDPAEVKADDRASLNQALDEIFGTPTFPTVEPGDAANKDDFNTIAGSQYAAFGAKDDDIDALGLDPYTLYHGSKLYRRHCLHCHGVPGDGRGPTGPWVDPHPRDYRQGVFKFISTSTDVVGRKPRREDLYRTLEKGIDGTSMPAFGLLPRKELDQLVSYVIHLSLRGQVEFDTIKALTVSRDQLEGGDARKFAYKQTGILTAQWAVSNAGKPSEPPAYAVKDDELQASIRRGYFLFIDKDKGNCASCHVDYGRQSAYRYDAWGTFVRPRNLTDPQYRGGRRPIDLYWRINGGIGPSNMPQLPTAIQAAEKWDLVNFVQHVPYPQMLPEDVRKAVYPGQVKTQVTSRDR